LQRCGLGSVAALTALVGHEVGRGGLEVWGILALSVLGTVEVRYQGRGREQDFESPWQQLMMNLHGLELL